MAFGEIIGPIATMTQKAPYTKRASLNTTSQLRFIWLLDAAVCSNARSDSEGMPTTETQDPFNTWHSAETCSRAQLAKQKLERDGRLADPMYALVSQCLPCTAEYCDIRLRQANSILKYGLVHEI